MANVQSIVQPHYYKINMFLSMRYLLNVHYCESMCKGGSSDVHFTADELKDKDYNWQLII